MKKFLSLATALLLVGALSIFAGCGKGERSGVIKGNYTEPTKAELQSALDAIDTEKLLGDTGGGRLEDGDVAGRKPFL